MKSALIIITTVATAALTLGPQLAHLLNWLTSGL